MGFIDKPTHPDKLEHMMYTFRHLTATQQTTNPLDPPLIYDYKYIYNVYIKAFHCYSGNTQSFGYNSDIYYITKQPNSNSINRHKGTLADGAYLRK